MDTMEHQEPNDLRRCREGHGFTQAMLGRLLGFRDGSWVSRWEHGEALPNLESAIKLSILLHTPVDELFSHLTKKAQAAIMEQEIVVCSRSDIIKLNEEQ